jgi:tetratricopeptide (TPR) repeat protein
LAEKAVRISPLSGNIWNTLGVARYRAGDSKRAVEDLTKSMQLRHGGDSADFFFLAMAHHDLGDTEAALCCFEWGAAWMDDHGPPNEEIGRFRAEAEALPGIRTRLASRAATRANDSASVVRQKPATRDVVAAGELFAQAATARARGDLTEAEGLYCQALDLQRKVLGPHDLKIAMTLIQLAGLMQSQGRYKEAEPFNRECLSVRQSALPAGDWAIATAKGALGETLAGEGKYDQAEPLLLTAYAELKARPTGRKSMLTIQVALERIVKLYQDWHKPAQLAQWSAELNALKASTQPSSQPATGPNSSN